MAIAKEFERGESEAKFAKEEKTEGDQLVEGAAAYEKFKIQQRQPQKKVLQWVLGFVIVVMVIVFVACSCAATQSTGRSLTDPKASDSKISCRLTCEIHGLNTINKPPTDFTWIHNDMLTIHQGRSINVEGPAIGWACRIRQNYKFEKKFRACDSSVPAISGQPSRN